MGVGSLANETGDSHALRISERATRFFTHTPPKALDARH